MSALAARRLRLRQAERVGCASSLVGWPRENQERPFVSGTKGRAFRGATLIRRCRTLVTDGPARVSAIDRSALPCIAGALRRSLLTSAARAASRSVRRLPGPFPRRRRSGSHQPPDLWVDARRVLVPFTARLFVMSAEYGHEPREASSTWARGPMTSGDAGVRRPEARGVHPGERRPGDGLDAVDECHDEILVELGPGRVLEAPERLGDVECLAVRPRRGHRREGVRDREDPRDVAGCRSPASRST